MARRTSHLSLLLILSCMTVAAFPQASASQHPTPDEQKYMQLADSASNYMKLERWDDARRNILQALKTQPANPSNPLLFSNLGLCQSNLGLYDQALQSFEIALIKAPHSPKVLLNRVRTYIAMNRLGDAMTDLDHIIERDSAHVNALSLRATLLLKDNQPQKAMSDFTALDSLQPDDPFILTGLAQCHDATGEYDKATPLFNRALNLSEESEIQLAAIIHFIARNDLNRADDVVRQAIKQHPREGMLYLYRALLHRLRFQNSDAELDKKLAREYGVDSQIIESIMP